MNYVTSPIPILSPLLFMTICGHFQSARICLLSFSMPEASSCIILLQHYCCYGNSNGWLHLFAKLYGCMYYLQAKALIYFLGLFGMVYNYYCVVMTMVVVGYACDLLPEAILYFLQTYLMVAMTTIQMVHKCVLSLMLIHTTIVKIYSITCG